jgi:hypothetical protein
VCDQSYEDAEVPELQIPFGNGVEKGFKVSGLVKHDEAVLLLRR